MFRRVALKIGVTALFAVMTWNAYLAISHLRQTHKIAALTLASSMIQADISAVLKDLTDMETGQRGFLLTDNPSYYSLTATPRAGLQLILPTFASG